MYVLRTVPIFVLAIAVAGCLGPPRSKPVLDQSAPKAGLLSFFRAVQSGDPEPVKKCIFLMLRNDALANDAAELLAASADLCRVVDSKFPGEGNKLMTGVLTNGDLTAALRHFKDSMVVLSGDQATIRGTGDEDSPGPIRQDWNMHNDHGNWKVDLRSMLGDTRDWDAYPPIKGKASTTVAMFFMMHEGVPWMRQIARDVESGKLKSIEEFKKAMEKAGAEANASATAKIE